MSTGARNRRVGAFGERLAADWLVARGMVVLDRNWRCPDGEVDLVLRDGDVLVLCEVKTRSTAAYGHPVEAVREVKADRVALVGARWMEWRGVSPAAVRVDLVGVLLHARGAPEIEHVRGVGR